MEPRGYSSFTNSRRGGRGRGGSSNFRYQKPSERNEGKQEIGTEQQRTFEQKHVNRNSNRESHSQNSNQVITIDTVEFTTPIIDIGVNLDHPQFKADLDSVITRAIQAKVFPMIITGTSVRSSISGQKLASRFNNKHNETHKKNILFSTAGVHPHDAKSCNENTISILRDLATKNAKEVVAIGECGLDFNRNFSPQDVQEEWFAKQIELAIETGLPLFLHERDAHQSFVKIWKQYHERLVARGVNAVVHCCTSSAEEVKTYVQEFGLYIGFTGVICQTQRGKPLRDLISNGFVPIDRVMIETDAPFMTPPLPNTQKQQRTRNEPGFLPLVLETLAELYGETPARMAEITTANTIRFFNLQDR